jgi:hypothetical protein
MHYRKAVQAALLLTFIPLAASAAPVTVDKRDYKLTYGDGWAASPFLPSTDSTSMVMKEFGADEEGGTAITWTSAMNGVSEATAPQYIAALTMAYQQGLVRTDSSTKSLGGKSFITTGWKDTSAEDSTGRVRIYALQQGSFLFISWLVYDAPQGDAAVAEVEAALATLEIKATGIRRLAWDRRIHPARARIDVLGRTWRPSAGHVPTGPFFLKR